MNKYLCWYQHIKFGPKFYFSTLSLEQNDRFWPNFICDAIKSLLDFGDLDLIFKVTSQRLYKSVFSVLYLLPEPMGGLDQTCIDTLLGGDKMLIRFW